MRAGRKRQERRGWPAEEDCNRVRQQRADPTEVGAYVTSAPEPGVPLGAERAGEENREKKENDPANLAGEGRATARVLVRAW